jgi:hypothetical protein
MVPSIIQTSNIMLEIEVIETVQFLGIKQFKFVGIHDTECQVQLFNGRKKFVCSRDYSEK